MHANKIHAPYDRHHKVSPSPNPHHKVSNSVKQLIVCNMKYPRSQLCAFLDISEMVTYVLFCCYLIFRLLSTQWTMKYFSQDCPTAMGLKALYINGSGHISVVVRSSWVIENAKSSSHPLTCSAPQVSVLGPILYLLYTTPLGNTMRRHGISYHM